MVIDPVTRRAACDRTEAILVVQDHATDKNDWAGGWTSSQRNEMSACSIARAPKVTTADGIGCAIRVRCYVFFS